MIYLVWESLALLLSKSKVNKKRATLFMGSILWLLMSIRSWDIGLNDTRGIFYRDFNRLSGISLGEALRLQPFIKEPLMNAYTWLLNMVFAGNFQLFLAVSSLIPTVAVVWLILKKTDKPLYGLLTYFAMFYFYQSFMIKQMIALSFVIFSIQYLNSRKLAKYCFFIILAGLFHKSAYILLVAYPLCKYLKFGKKYFIILISAMALGVSGGHYILNFLYKLSFYDFRLYIATGIYTTNNNFNFSILMFPAICFLAFILRDKNLDSREQNDYFILMFTGCVLNSWSIVVAEFYRLAVYFFVCIIFILPNMITRMPRRYRNLAQIALLSFLCIYAYKSALNSNCLPYKVFFE